MVSAETGSAGGRADLGHSETGPPRIPSRDEAALHGDRADDTANQRNLALLIQLRWLAITGQVTTILIAKYWLGIGLPLPQMGAILVFLVGLNVVAHVRHESGKAVTNTELFFELLLDVAALTAQLYLSGGATNPFISLYLLQVTLGAVLLEAWSTWVLVVVTSVGFAWLTNTYEPLRLPPYLSGELFTLHVLGMVVCFVLAAGLLVLFISRINRNLRARDERLAELRQQSAERDHIVRMGLLASGAAHELGTPLATLSVILGDWRRIPSLHGNPEIAEEIAEMQRQVDRCKTIVSGILMSSGEARGEGTVRTTVRSFVDELVEEWQTSRSPRRLDYEDVFDPDEAIVSDAALKQVIFNVLDNALEASPDWVGVTVSRRSDKLAITVSDAGQGFEKHMLAEFGKPYRSSKSHPGSGLGLFLVVNVIRTLGGSVKAENRREGGASVTLTLPLASLFRGRE